MNEKDFNVEIIYSVNDQLKFDEVFNTVRLS